MSIREKILKRKKEKNAIILAHNYQIPEIQDIADFLGDSLELAKISRNLEEKIIIFCGVKFMAETAKILSPGKKVLLPVQNAGCSLADMADSKRLRELKDKHPNAWVVSYVNTSAEIKALSDVCCTSGNAIETVRNVPVKEIIFVPDRNLGWWVKKNVPEKEIIIWPGFCFVHEYFSLKELEEARRFYPEAEVMAHPECSREILEEADFVFSTSGMLKRAGESSAKKFIVGTEEGLIYRLRKENPKKEFYSLGNAKICIDMKKINLENLYRAIEWEDYPIEIDSNILDRAKMAIERMVLSLK